MKLRSLMSDFRQYWWKTSSPTGPRACQVDRYRTRRNDRNDRNSSSSLFNVIPNLRRGVQNDVQLVMSPAEVSAVILAIQRKSFSERKDEPASGVVVSQPFRQESVRPENNPIPPCCRGESPELPSPQQCDPACESPVKSFRQD